MNDSGSGFIRVRHVGRVLSGGRSMTPSVVAAVVRKLRSATTQEGHLEIPPEALAIVGVESVEQLEVTVERGRIVLTPRAVKEA